MQNQCLFVKGTLYITVIPILYCNVTSCGLSSLYYNACRRLAIIKTNISYAPSSTILAVDEGSTHVMYCIYFRTHDTQRNEQKIHK